ncbi:hypothetical protein [Marinovum sp.]|uniref:hypothetical protein n=1 Tax=Marinovum sp. TaxID=2024839 RepID=UPI002B264F03|nr:hypothetical protein [Marinovum sp.]
MLETTETPRAVWRGNPVQSDHQPDPERIVALLEEILALAASTADLSLVTGALDWQGVWDAAANSPAIPAAAVGNSGHLYWVGTAGSTALDGISGWAVGDYVVSDGSTWNRIRIDVGVLSIGGKSGPVTLEAADIDDSSAAGRALLLAADAAAQRAALEITAMEQVEDDASGKAELIASDENGFAFFRANEDRIVGAGMVAERGGDRTLITDLRGFQYDDRTPAPGLAAPLLPQRLFGVTGVEFGLHRDGLLEDRDTEARMLLNGATGLQLEGQEMLRCDLSGLGVSATVSLRATTCAARYGEQSVTVHTAPQSPGTGNAPAVLLVGDSITHRGAGAMLDYWLDAWGYVPSFIGTLTGEAETDPTDGVTALAATSGEGKPGHALADLTYLFTGRVSPLAPGSEATYDSETVDNKRLYNTMIRAASGEPAADQRNGYVLDFANYVSRHGLATPDMLVIGYGTNDIRDCGIDVIRAHFFDEYSLVFRRWFASYPNKHVVVWMPGTAADFTRSRVWTHAYAPALKGLIAAASAETAANAGAGEVLVVPAWAMAAQGAGYDLSTSTETVDADTSGVLRQIEDTIHPTAGTRFATLKSIAAAIACAIQGEI